MSSSESDHNSEKEDFKGTVTACLTWKHLGI